MIVKDAQQIGCGSFTIMKLGAGRPALLAVIFGEARSTPPFGMITSGTGRQRDRGAIQQEHPRRFLLFSK